jgi:hypothetical protein
MHAHAINNNCSARHSPEIFPSPIHPVACDMVRGSRGEARSARRRSTKLLYGESSILCGASKARTGQPFDADSLPRRMIPDRNRGAANPDSNIFFSGGARAKGDHLRKGA